MKKNIFWETKELLHPQQDARGAAGGVHSSPLWSGLLHEPPTEACCNRACLIGARAGNVKQWVIYGNLSWIMTLFLIYVSLCICVSKATFKSTNCIFLDPIYTVIVLFV